VDTCLSGRDLSGCRVVFGLAGAAGVAEFTDSLLSIAWADGQWRAQAAAAN